MDAEVALVGAGTVGSSLACSLAEQGIKVILFDRDSPIDLPKTSRLEGSTVALNLSSIDLFDELGILIQLKKKSTPFTLMFVWDSQGS